MRTELYIDFRDQTLNKLIFDLLTAKKTDLEAKFGERFEWERLDNRRASRIAVYCSGSIDGNEAELANLHQWGIIRLLKFKEVFGPILVTIRDEAQTKLAESDENFDEP